MQPRKVIFPAEIAHKMKLSKWGEEFVCNAMAPRQPKLVWRQL